MGLTIVRELPAVELRYSATRAWRASVFGILVALFAVRRRLLVSAINRRLATWLVMGAAFRRNRTWEGSTCRSACRFIASAAGVILGGAWIDVS